MKCRMFVGLGTVAALSLLAFASTASATTLETNGVKQTGAISLDLSLKAGTSKTLGDTSGAFANTCTTGTIAFSDTTSQTGTTVSGPASTVTFSHCTHEKVVVHKTGTVSIEWTSGTNGSVRWSGAEVTFPVTILGSVVTATCKTSETVLGTLTGVASGAATFDMNAVLNCGSFLPSAKWQATWVTTTSTGGSHAVGVIQ